MTRLWLTTTQSPGLIKSGRSRTRPPRLPGGDRDAGADGLTDPRARGDVEVGAQENHLTALAVGPQHQHLGDERADLFGREVHHGDDPPPDQVPWPVAVGHLGAGAL